MKKSFTLIAFILMSGIVAAQSVYSGSGDDQNVEFTGWPNVTDAIANPDPSGINTSDGVAEWERSGEVWAHICMDLKDKVDISTGEHFYLKAWPPIACEVLFKREDQKRELYLSKLIKKYWMGGSSQQA